MSLKEIIKTHFLLLFNIIAFCCLSIKPVKSEEIKIVINPLINYHQQIKEINKECIAAGMPEECKTRLKGLSDEMEKLRKYCGRNSNDFRCDALDRHNEERASALEDLCNRDPYADKCVRHRSSLRANQLHLVKYCKEKPDSSRCRPNAPPKKKEPFIVKYCKLNPEKRSCVKYYDDERSKKDPYYKEDRKNLF
jgi:hypothetical protein